MVREKVALVRFRGLGAAGDGIFRAIGARDCGILHRFGRVFRLHVFLFVCGIENCGYLGISVLSGEACGEAQPEIRERGSEPKGVATRNSVCYGCNPCNR